jgi:dienelactone hydrolase
MSRPLSPTTRLAGLALLFLSMSPCRAALDAVPQTRLDEGLRCLLGVYALPSQRHLTLTGADGQARELGYTLSDGRFGRLREASAGTFVGDGLALRAGPCDSPTLSVQEGTAVVQARRVPLVQQHSTFVSDGLALHGKLVRPAAGPVRAMAVWIEGSNNNPSTDDSVWPYELALRGVAVFVHDKRGTGRSAGTPSSDLQARARDTAAAVAEARRLAPEIGVVGLIGASQGGWVAPLVSTLVPVDFVVAAFAMAEGPVAQDQAVVRQQLQDAGADAPARAAAEQLLGITERIVRSGMAEGLAELDAFKAAFDGAAWLRAIQPRSYTGLFLQFSSADIQARGPALAQGLRFDYDPRPLIEALPSRQLWLLAGRDRQAPGAGTQAFLRRLQQTRQDVDVVVFAAADHGLIEPARPGGGMAYSPGVFDTAARWVTAGQLPPSGRTVYLRGQP